MLQWQWVEQSIIMQKIKGSILDYYTFSNRIPEERNISLHTLFGTENTRHICGKIRPKCFGL